MVILRKGKDNQLDKSVDCLHKSNSVKVILTKVSKIMFNAFELCLIKYILYEYVKIIINN